MYHKYLIKEETISWINMCACICMYVPSEEFGDGMGREDGRLIAIGDAPDERLEIFVCDEGGEPLVRGDKGLGLVEQ